MRYLLELDSVGKRFGGNQVLHAASLWATPSAVTYLVGRGGAGKSTMLRIATGAIAADSGYVRFDGTTCFRPRLHRLARRSLFYLPDRDLLSRRMTVRRQLALTRRLLGLSSGGVSETEAADQLGLTELVDRLPGALSEGERRRAELAMALVRNPRCLLADEPFRHLAPTDAEAVAGALRFLARQGCGIVITGHEVTWLFGVADRVTWCTSGTTQYLGTVAEARRHWRFCRDYLGVRPLEANERDLPAAGDLRQAYKDVDHA